MKITNYYISKRKNSNMGSNITGKWFDYESDIDISLLKNVYNAFKKNSSIFLSDEQKNELAETTKIIFIEKYNNIKTNEEITEINKEINSKETLLNTIQKLIDFFTEFDFEPNFRFVNTFTNKCKNSYIEAKQYVSNYFKLTDNSYSNAIIDKMTSSEFKSLIDEFSKVDINKTINTRFKLYYGSQGTGKTTMAMKEANGEVMVCHSAMLPSDLMEDFEFDDGKASFKPSALLKAMQNGKTIVLDEINLLPFESLRFLQSLLDGKKQFIYKGTTIEIKEGFKIIGTMNLQVNGMTYALPEPLVDRAEDLKQFKLTANNLLNAIL